MNVSRKHIVFTLVTMIAAVILVSVLGWSALKPVNSKNGFNRTSLPGQVQLLSVISKPADVTDFAGFQGQNVIFKTADPAKLYGLNSDLQVKGYLDLDFPNLDKKQLVFTCIVDSAGITTFSGNTRTIIDYNSQRKATLYNFPGVLFTKAVKISEGNYIFRAFEKADQIFAKGNPSSGSFEKEVNISEKNKDAGISTDGMLHYDKTNNGVVYVYYHSNEFLYMDTNLNLLYKGHTIDTLSQSKVKTAELKGNLITSKTPKRFSNATNAVANGFLYNRSRLVADNESQEEFKQNASIDVYNLATGQYIGSFRIPDTNGEKLYKFRVNGNRLYVLYKKYIASYQLNFPVLIKK
jgi:hypothetical protein